MVDAARRYYAFDALMYFIEDLTLTASDVIQEGGVDKVLDVGAGRVDGTMLIDVAALDIASNDELYTFRLQGSNVADFASGIENLATVDLGATEVRPGGAIDSLIGRREVPFSNAVNAVEYRYLRLNLIISGTTPTITFTSWLGLQSPG